TAQDALMRKAELLKQPPRPFVAGVNARRQALQLQRSERMIHNRLHRLPRVAFAPRSAAKQESDLGALVVPIDIGDIAFADGTAVHPRRHSPPESRARGCLVVLGNN